MDWVDNLNKYTHGCQHCGRQWESYIENPKRCENCYKLLKYKTRYVKSGGLQRICISDKCYSMLLRRKKTDDEKISSVIQRLLKENKFSETVRYKHEECVHKINCKPELLMQIYELSNEYNIKYVNEIIWRLL